MSCCDEKAVIQGIYKPLNERLIEYGKEAFSDVQLNNRTILWIFSFYEQADDCEECRSSFSDMWDWFHKYGLFNNPVRSVKSVVEPEPHNNLIYNDLGFTKLPMHLFCDENGKIFDIILGFPSTAWLDTYILPIVKNDITFNG